MHPLIANTSGDDNVATLPPGGLDLVDRLEDIEKELIIQALDRCGRVVTRAADLLHMNVRALRYRIKKLELRNHGEDAPGPPAGTGNDSDRNLHRPGVESGKSTNPL